jgi:hypothetical protein
MDDLKDRRGYSHFNEEVLDRTMWRNRFGRGFGPVVRQNTEWMSKYWSSLFQYTIVNYGTDINKSQKTKGISLLHIFKRCIMIQVTWESSKNAGSSRLKHYEPRNVRNYSSKEIAPYLSNTAVKIKICQRHVHKTCMSIYSTKNVSFQCPDIPGLRKSHSSVTIK